MPLRVTGWYSCDRLLLISCRRLARSSVLSLPSPEASATTQEGHGINEEGSGQPVERSKGTEKISVPSTNEQMNRVGMEGSTTCRLDEQKDKKQRKRRGAMVGCLRKVSLSLTGCIRVVTYIPLVLLPFSLFAAI
jgi:hypothetical protein